MRYNRKEYSQGLICFIFVESSDSGIKKLTTNAAPGYTKKSKNFLSTRDTKMNGRVIKKKLNPLLASWYVG